MTAFAVTELSDVAAIDWIAVDWGTSNLRVSAIGSNGPLATRSSDKGMSCLTRDQFEPALMSLIEDWLPLTRVMPVLACGMVGSRQGWVEAKYRAVPCVPMDQNGLIRVKTHSERIDVYITPGLSQTKPADVMRGEETQIAGALSLYPNFDGVICLPGTHSKWAHISAGEVVSFQTFMTGELYALLSGQSVLRHGLTDAGWDDAAFDSGVDDALSRPEKIAARLFTLRAEALLQNLPSASARARLSGLLIGIELAAAKPYWLGQSVMLIGADSLSDAYEKSLIKQGLNPKKLPSQACIIAGLASVRTPK
jgi:2-dehydro-3-deoxygalactonokinase